MKAMKKYEPVKDIRARTEAQQGLWSRIVRRSFPDALQTTIGEYGFRVRLPHPDTAIRYYTIVWRYGGIPADLGERVAQFDWLRSVGEEMGSLDGIRYRQGQVHTHNS